MATKCKLTGSKKQPTDVCKQSPITVSSPAAVHVWAIEIGLTESSQEELWVLCIDSRNKVRRAEMVARGSETHAEVTASCLFRAIIYSGFNRCILVHNHPSGSPLPSPEDIRYTEKVVKGSVILDIIVLDHVVVATESFYSMREQGAFKFA